MCGEHGSVSSEGLTLMKSNRKCLQGQMVSMVDCGLSWTSVGPEYGRLLSTITPHEHQGGMKVDLPFLKAFTEDLYMAPPYCLF